MSSHAKVLTRKSKPKRTISTETDYSLLMGTFHKIGVAFEREGEGGIPYLLVRITGNHFMKFYFTMEGKFSYTAMVK